MKLLSIKTIKEQKKKTFLVDKKRIDAFKKEEADICSKLNKTIDLYEEKSDYLENDFKTFTKKLEKDKKILLKEVLSLEKRRDKAMKPIKEIRVEAENILTENNILKKQLLDEKKDLECGWSDLFEKISENVDIASELKEEQQELDKRVLMVNEAEKKVKVSTDNLSKSWIEYHKEITKTNLEITKQKLELEGERKAINALVEEIARTRVEQRNERIALQDAYATLQKAKDEIYGKR